VLHPWSHGCRSRAKEWPIRRWLDLARRIQATGRVAAITGSPGDRPRTDRLLGRWLAGTSGVVDLVGRTSLAQLAQVLQRAQCVVSVNTGVVHLAAALDCPVISLDGVTPAWRWGPLGIHACSLGPGLAQYTYLNLGNESPTPGYAHGMRQIACQAVFECLVEKLEQAGTRRDRQRKMEPSAHVGAAAAGMVG